MRVERGMYRKGTRGTFISSLKKHRILTKLEITKYCIREAVKYKGIS